MPSRAIITPLAALLALQLAAVGAGAQDSWEESYWNRQAMEDDLVLPLPCGGAMAFRPVAIKSADNWLSDMAIELGSTEAEAPFSEYPHAGFIAGSISSDGRPDERLYYLGKYEVTKDQFAAVMDDSCPRPSGQGSFPAENLSWFEAVEFTRRLSEWLLANAIDQLPHEDGVPAFVRLPTEAEWEFAARGGMAVTDSQRRDRLPPMEGEIDLYAWFDAPGSCDGATQPVGLKRPNPLGLFDMLGNVQEILLEPYRMTVAGRLHGQVGGFIAKGGSCNSRRELLRSAERQEKLFFDPFTGKAERPQFTGLRVALVAPVQTSVPRISQLREDWENTRRQRSEATEGADPLDALAGLIDETRDPDRKRALERVEASFSNEMQARNALDERSARMAIIAGAQMIRGYRADVRRVRANEKASQFCSDEADCDAHAGRLERAILNAEIGANALLDLLGHAVVDYRQELLESQLAAVLQQYGGFESGGFETFARRFVTLIGEKRATPGFSDAEVLERVLQ